VVRLSTVFSNGKESGKKSKRLPSKGCWWQLEQVMQEQQNTKHAMAKELHTSRSQLDRLLDPRNVSVTVDTITRAAGRLV
jgi:hypothetical protein